MCRLSHYVIAVLVGGLWLGACPAPAWAVFAQNYTLVPIDGGARAIGTDTGQVVGALPQGDGTFQPAVLWPSPQILGPTREGDAYATAGAWTVGNASFPSEGPYVKSHAFLANAQGLTDLGALGGPGSQSAATCVNQDGDAWGWGTGADGFGWVPLFWPAGGAPLELPSLGDQRGGVVTGCNDLGAAVGATGDGSSSNGGAGRCTSWPADGSPPVSCDPGQGSTYSRGVAVTNSNVIAANVEYPDGFQGLGRGYLWYWSGMQWLAPLPDDQTSWVTGLNAQAEAVGLSCASRSAGCRAVGWRQGVAFALFPRVINATGPDPRQGDGLNAEGRFVSWDTMQAVGIDNEGHILVARAGRGFPNEKVAGVLVPVLTSPPVITITATPETLWPPNGKLVPVTVSGKITDAGSGVNASTAAYVVTDEYGLIQPSSYITNLNATTGNYTFTIQLQASRNGNDRDGREYIITVYTKDNAGNTGSAATSVRVARDQGG
jgi:hypothetical protein